MEPVRRIKFKTNFLSKEIPDEKEIEELKHWCNQFHKNNLTSEFQGASVGNLSTRVEDYFIITASVLKSKESLNNDSFVRVINYDVYNNIFFVEGMSEPSSESIMHYLIYNTRDDVNAIFHGHNDLIIKNAEKLKIPVTKNEQPPGTMELANEVLDILGNNNIIVVKNGGFVTLGGTMKDAGQLALNTLKKSTKI